VQLAPLQKSHRMLLMERRQLQAKPRMLLLLL
jgi:hypothetical protein